VNTGLNFDAIQKELDRAEWQEYDEYCHVKSVFLGTVFALVPSGKYYTPWACGNVEVCPDCKGERITNPKITKVYYAIPAARFWAKRHGLPRSIMLASYKIAKMFEPVDCKTCGGFGSAEAYQDQLWYAEVDRLADPYEFYIENGEGDPCDLFAVIYEDYE